MPPEIDAICTELRDLFGRSGDLPQRLADVIDAPRLLIYGQGRTGLALRALTMRLAQLGRDAHFLNDTAPKPLRPGDTFLVNASRGDLASAIALLARARSIGARTALLTGVETGEAHAHADVILHIPAQTWDGSSVLPLGGQYEVALWLLGDMAVELLMRRHGLSAPLLAAGHVNLG